MFYSFTCVILLFYQDSNLTLTVYPCKKCDLINKCEKKKLETDLQLVNNQEQFFMYQTWLKICSQVPHGIYHELFSVKIQLMCSVMNVKHHHKTPDDKYFSYLKIIQHSLNRWEIYSPFTISLNTYHTL